MKEVFTYLLDFSVVTSAAILLAILLRPLLKKGPSFIRCILWALVFLRLLVPVGVAELPILERDTVVPPLSGETVSVPTGDAVGESVQTPDGQMPNGLPSVTDTVPDAKPSTAPVTDQNLPQADSEPQKVTKFDTLFLLSVLWAAGAAVMLGYMLASNLLLRYRMRDAIVYDSKIRVMNRDCSPFVFGFFRPIIYVPASVNQTDWPHIIAHETSHIKRFDHILKPLAFFVLCFYWYNPLVWAAYILLGKDIEYACDERTVKRMENRDRRAYSLALLAASQGGNIAFAPPLSFGKVSVKERIKRVMTRRIPVWAVCIAIVICVALSFLTVFTLAEANSGETSFEEEASETSSEASSDANADAEAGPRTYALPATVKRVQEDIVGRFEEEIHVSYEDGGLLLSRGGDVTFRCKWDEQGRLKWEQYPWTGMQITYDYDENGNLVRKTQFGGSGENMRTEYVYDGLGRCTEATVIVDPERIGGRISYSYDGDGTHMTELQYTAGGEEVLRLEYELDEAGNALRMVETDNSGSVLTVYTYDGAGHTVQEAIGMLGEPASAFNLYEYGENGVCLKRSRRYDDGPVTSWSEVTETVGVTLSEEALQTVLRVLLAHY